MTTLSVDAPRVVELGEVNEIPVIAADIVFEGAAVGIVDATGHARPLVAGDLFAGFCELKVDNTLGVAAALNVRMLKKGAVQLLVTGAVITDVGQPVFASDDDTFTFTPTGNSYIGVTRRFVSAGVVIVEFDAENRTDPYRNYGSPEHYETVTGNKTLDIQDNGRVFFLTASAVLTLPAVATGLACTIVNIAPFGTIQISVSPAAADSIHAPDLAGVDDKDHILTTATSKRGDLVSIIGGLVATGYNVTRQKGIWAQEP